MHIAVCLRKGAAEVGIASRKVVLQVVVQLIRALHNGVVDVGAVDANPAHHVGVFLGQRAVLAQRCFLPCLGWRGVCPLHGCGKLPVNSCLPVGFYAVPKQQGGTAGKNRCKKRKQKAVGSLVHGLTPPTASGDCVLPRSSQFFLPTRTAAGGRAGCIRACAPLRRDPWRT